LLGYVVRKVECSALIVEEKIAIAQNGHQITHSPRNLRCEGLQERYVKDKCYWRYVNDSNKL